MKTPLLLTGGFEIAEREFARIYYAVTGRKIPVVSEPSQDADLVVIGSDAVNPFVHKLIMENKLEAPDIRSGSDDYHLLSFREGSRKILLLAGGRPRADLYAVYDYFEQFCGCCYFWDGDLISHLPEIPLDGIDFRKKFRFQYRGLRYFAHRSLHRFQAEHWEFDEWKHEIDYLLKKRFNLFMLRIGLDDLFQKAFPDIVDYPPENEQAPEAIEKSYNDRTSFWPLRYRGELRKQILDYAFERDLLHPEDFGPVTHWYSRTPIDFLEKVKPELLAQETSSYSENSGMVWDFSLERNFENYLKLSRAHIKHYGRPDMFHMIGLAERIYGGKEENLKLKLYAYRRFIRHLRQQYPNAPLLLASWDFLTHWQSDEVKKLLEELDPENTLIFDYTTDSHCAANNFESWELPGNFPWIFGIFQTLEPSCDLNFDFTDSEEHLAKINSDSMCKGIVLWSENSHSNPLLLEHLAVHANSSGPLSLKRFCKNRYGDEFQPLLELWEMVLPEFGINAWKHDEAKPLQGILCNHFNLLHTVAGIGKRYEPEKLVIECRRRIEALPSLSDFFARCARIDYGNKFIHRDLIDLCRTHLMNMICRELCVLQLALWEWRQSKTFNARPERLLELICGMRDLLSKHDDFSMYKSLLRLARHRPINPYSELTLKGNAENSYCRSYIYELYQGIYVPEAESYIHWINNILQDGNPGLLENTEYLRQRETEIRDIFYATPLQQLSPENNTKALTDILNDLNNLT